MNLVRSQTGFPAAFAIVAALLPALSCTAASTSVTAPTSSKCEVGATIAPSSFPHQGGAGAMTITTERDCTWSVAVDAAWINISSRAGQGPTTVNYTVSENPVPAARSATVSVESARLQLSQAAAPCVYDLTPTQGSIAAAGGNLSFGVSVLSGCGWTAASTVSWISVVSGQSGNGNGTVGLVVASNNGGHRTGSVTVAGLSYSVTQDAKPSGGDSGSPPSPPPTIPPPPPPPSPPPPPPPAGERVEFEGRVSNKSGSCPSVAFIAASRIVATHSGTTYKDGKCGDLSNGDRVKVRGVKQPSGYVLADRIEFKDDDDDDDDDDDVQ